MLQILDSGVASIDSASFFPQLTLKYLLIPTYSFISLESLRKCAHQREVYPVLHIPAQLVLCGVNGKTARVESHRLRKNSEFQNVLNFGLIHPVLSVLFLHDQLYELPVKR